MSEVIFHSSIDGFVLYLLAIVHRYGYIIRDILKYFEVKYLDFTLKHLGKKQH